MCQIKLELTSHRVPASARVSFQGRSRRERPPEIGHKYFCGGCERHLSVQAGLRAIVTKRRVHLSGRRNLGQSGPQPQVLET